MAIFITLLGIYVGFKENEEIPIKKRNIYKWISEIIALIICCIIWLLALIFTSYIKEYQEPIALAIITSSCAILMYILFNILKVIWKSYIDII